MSEAMSIPSGECYLSAIDIPSIAAKLSGIKKEMLNASLLIPKLQTASVNLEYMFRKSNFVNFAVLEAAALRESVHTLECNLEVAVSEIQKRMTSLEVILSRNVIIPPILSTADDVSVAFHIAVNGPVIDWPFAEIVLERYLFLKIEDYSGFHKIGVNGFVETVWHNNDFESNMIKLLEAGDCWRVRKSLESLSEIVGNASSNLSVSTEMFESLVSILLQPIRSSAEDEMLQWVYLIAKNQPKAVDHGILRLINSGLYSRKEKTSIACTVLKIISSFMKEFWGYNFCHFSLILDTPKALVKILMEEIDDENVIKTCFRLVYDDITHNEGDLENECSNYVREGICEALVLIMRKYLINRELIEDVLFIVHLIVGFEEHIPRFMTANLLEALVSACNTSIGDGEYLTQIIENLCLYDDDIIEQFGVLGIVLNN